MAYPQGVNYPTKHNHTDLAQLSFVIHYHVLISLSAAVHIKRPDPSGCVWSHNLQLIDKKLKKRRCHPRTMAL